MSFRGIITSSEDSGIYECSNRSRCLIREGYEIDNWIRPRTIEDQGIVNRERNTAMTITEFRFRIVGFALVLAVIPTTAEAAKGVKKVQPDNAHHSTSGVVFKISPDKTGYGTFQLRTAHPLSKNDVGNPVVNAKGKTNPLISEFKVTSATRFEQRAGKAVSVAPPTALKKGERVRVLYTANQAETIQILLRPPSTGQIIRYRASSYHPRAYHRPVASPHLHATAQPNIASHPHHVHARRR